MANESIFHIDEDKIIIISPYMISILLKKVLEFTGQPFRLPVNSFVPEGYIEYMQRVINTNRVYNQHFQVFSSKKVIRKKDMIRLVELQVKKLMVDEKLCFCEFKLRTDQKELAYMVTPAPHMFEICLDRVHRKLYMECEIEY